MTVLNNRLKEEIEKIAELVISESEVSIPEDDIISVVDALGGMVIYDSSMGVYTDAKLKKTNRAATDAGIYFVITVSSKQSEEDIRYEVAKNIGNLFLHMDYENESVWKSNASDIYYRPKQKRDEEESKVFALAFLMPKEKFIRFVKETAMDGKIDPEMIARHFMVSRDKAILRGENLGVFSQSN